MHFRALDTCGCVLAVAAAGLLSFPASAGQEGELRPAGPVLSIATPTGPLSPGDVGRLIVTAPSSLAGVEGQVLGRPIRFWSTASLSEWHGLVGVGLSVGSGVYTAVIQATGADGTKGVARSTLRVQPKRFETRRLKVDPALVNPPADQAARIARESKAVADAFAAVRPERLWRGPFEAPVPGIPTSSFGRLTVMNGESRGRHQGADFRATLGTPVRAPNAGRVVLAQDLYFSGNTVILDHGLSVFSLLAHLSRIDVAVGATVSRGDLLGESGATGRVTGPHLHWAVRLGETSVDPMSLMKAVAGLPDEVDVKERGGA